MIVESIFAPVFDLRGPEFLAFYAAFAAFVLFLAYVVRRVSDGSPDVPRIADPYSLAYLRGGAREAVRVAILSLVLRGALKETSAGFSATDRTTASGPFETAVVAGCDGRGVSADGIARSARVREALAAIRRRLTDLGCLADTGTTARRLLLLAVTAFLLLDVAGTKIAIALSRGRSNIGFLVFLALAATALAGWILLRSRTATGRQAVSAVRTLLEPARSRMPDPAKITPGTEEGIESAVHVALLVAAFGATALPASGAAFRNAIWPQAAAGGADHSTWSSGSGSTSCGSSSSCGGGGCGGGGCGGCGS